MRFLPYLALAAFCTATAAAQSVAFTWDDLPAHSSLPPGESRLQIAHSILKTMHQHGLPPAYGFVNGIRTQDEPGTESVLKAWHAAGNPLGNHTWSHMNLASADVNAWKRDVEKNEPLLQQYADGTDWHWLRYPNLAEAQGDKRIAIRAYLAEHKYRIASVTMSFGDYAWNAPYARCVAKHNKAAITQLEASYLRAADETIADTRAASRATLGRDIPYVLLMHIGALDAKMLPRLIALFKEHGFHFITLEQAEADPFYATDRYIQPNAPRATIEAAAATRGITLPPRPALPNMDNICR
jgi:peptidoglycan/xylan/chitin deacetylase (PgdA/CDA1 family)